MRVVSRGGRAIASQSGLTLEVQGALERLRGPLDTVLVVGGQRHTAAAADTAFVGHVLRLARVTRRVASVGTGATVLAAAGLLDGRRATTHWMFADALAAAPRKMALSRLHRKGGRLFVKPTIGVERPEPTW